MKRFSVILSFLFSFLLFPVLYLFVKGKRKWALIYLLLIVVVCSGCFLNYYKTNTRQGTSAASLDSLKNSNKYFIVHIKEGPFALKNLKVNNNLLEADLDSVSPQHTHYLYPTAGRSPSYKKKYEDDVLTEVHLYAEDQTAHNHHLSIPFSSFTRVDVYEKNRNKTTFQHVISAVGLAVGGIYLISFIVLLIACNCPQVYVFDGEQYQFQSGVFSGAIYSSLEKTDYLPLGNLKATNGKYMLRLMNNQQEEQYVNQFQLIKISHDASKQVLLDRHGIIHTYEQPVTPIATSVKRDTLNQVLHFRDGNSYIFNEKGEASSPFGSVILTFDKPADITQAKLIVNAKNSLWSGYLFEAFSSLFGDQYQKFIARQDKADQQQIERWQKDQALPLMVYLETDKGWQLADYFALTGNTAGRDMIMQLNLPATKNNKVRIKLESAYMFWDVDYAAMDFSADAALKPTFIHPCTAIQSNNNSNEVSALVKKDNVYTKLLQNEYITADFDKPEEADNEKSSYFLVSTGYYHSLKQYTGKADLRKLYHFRKKGAFSEFSEKKFSEAQSMLAKGIDLPAGNK